jgi:hypothetical protein
VPGHGDLDPPVVEDGGGGGGSGWVPLLRARNDIEAHLLIGRLAESGVEATAVKDRRGPGAWLLGGSDAWAPVTVLVRRVQLDEARVVLAELAFEAPAVPSAVARRSAMTRRGPIAFWAAAIGLGVLFTGLGLMQAAAEIDRCAETTCSGSSQAP